jgi:hypothetical protein
MPGVVIAFGALVTAIPCNAAPDILAGKTYAQANRARCHSIDKFTTRPMITGVCRLGSAARWSILLAF